jgi:hypothetical protein
MISQFVVGKDYAGHNIGSHDLKSSFRCVAQV